MTVCKSTVVIPNYNGIKFIDACLESLYAGTTQNIEVIVVDNASNDGSLALIKEKYPQVHLIENQENTGFCHAVNQGILASKTPYVILLNNDTRAGLSFVHELEKIMDSCKEVFSASAKLISMYDHNKIDDAGDFYCALGWAFARGKGKIPVVIKRMIQFLLPVAAQRFIAEHCLHQIRLGYLMKTTLLTWKILTLATAHSYMDIRTDLRQTL